MSFLTHVHAELRRARLTRRGATHRPEDVARGTHKEYARMERVALPRVSLEMSLSDALERRFSTLRSGSEAPFTLEDMGALFGTLRRHSDSYRRMYPSGGALYPIESYLVTTALEGQLPSVFHYNPTLHALERLWGVPDGFEVSSLAPRPDFLTPSALIIFTSVWKRSSAKYGDLSYQHALLEAGHMSQNILLAGTARKLEVRPMAGFDDRKIAELLDLDEEHEQTVHTITVAKGARGLRELSGDEL